MNNTNSENDTTAVNINLEESSAEAEVSELRNDDSEIEDIEAKNNEVNDTINLPNDDTLECNGFVTIVESNEKEKGDYKTFYSLLKSIGSLEYNESPSLENFLNDHYLELSVNEENVSPPAPQEDSETQPEKEERLSRNKSKKPIQNQGVLTRSQSTNRYIDTSRHPMDPNDVIIEKHLKKP